MHRALLPSKFAVLLLAPLPAVAAPPTDPATEDPVTAHAEPRWFKGNLHTHSL
jgi:hypothetical protein